MCKQQTITDLGEIKVVVADRTDEAVCGFNSGQENESECNSRYRVAGTIWIPISQSKGRCYLKLLVQY